MKLHTLSAAVALIAAATTGHAATNLVQNGSFEYISSATTPGQGSGSWSVYSSIIGWTGMPNVEVRDNVSGKAQDGSNFVELDTHYLPTGQSNSGIFQDILGTGYVNLSFWYSARPNTGATNDLGFSFGGFSDNTILKTVSNSTGSHIWQQYTLNNFKLDSDGVTRLSFYALGRADTYGGSLDNVVVTSVPEPETYAMLLAGLGLMGAVARRRKQAA
jgi:PEP-CTERM motif